MDQFSELQCLGQIESSEAGRVFREFLRSQVRQSLVNIMAEEVRELCGPKYRPAIVEGRRQSVTRPRVRQTKEDGSVEDVTLTDKLTAEMSGILNWAIEGRNRLQSREHFEYDETQIAPTEVAQGFPDSERIRRIVVEYGRYEKPRKGRRKNRKRRSRSHTK